MPKKASNTMMLSILKHMGKHGLTTDSSLWTPMRGPMESILVEESISMSLRGSTRSDFLGAYDDALKAFIAPGTVDALVTAEAALLEAQAGATEDDADLGDNVIPLGLVEEACGTRV